MARFKQSLSADPRFFESADQLARVLSSHPDQTLRSHQEALALASRLCQFTKNQNARYLDTLAIASAANGNFEQAVARSGQALALYRAGGERFVVLVEVLEERLAFYKLGKPWVEAAWK